MKIVPLGKRKSRVQTASPLAPLCKGSWREAPEGLPADLPKTGVCMHIHAHNPSGSAHADPPPFTQGRLRALFAWLFLFTSAHFYTPATPFPSVRTGDCLAAARSRRGSDMPPACHSLPRRRFAALKGAAHPPIKTPSEKNCFLLPILL